MTRWGYTARQTPEDGVLYPINDARSDGPVRHAWDGRPARRTNAPVHALCGAPLRGLSPNREAFDPAHPRACRACRRQARLRTLG